MFSKLLECGKVVNRNIHRQKSLQKIYLSFFDLKNDRNNYICILFWFQTICKYNNCHVISDEEYVNKKFHYRVLHLRIVFCTMFLQWWVCFSSFIIIFICIQHFIPWPTYHILINKSRKWRWWCIWKKTKTK